MKDLRSQLVYLKPEIISSGSMLYSILKGPAILIGTVPTPGRPPRVPFLSKCGFGEHYAYRRGV